MTDIVFAVIDNHQRGRGKNYNIIFKTKKHHEFEKYVEDKGLN